MTDFLIPTHAETPRLRLRPFREADWAAMHAHYADPESTRYTLGRTLSEGESWRLTAALAGHWLLRGYGPYALEAKNDGRLLGTVGLWHPVDFPEREIKWALHPAERGQGYASEAARAVQRIAAAAFPGQPPISFIDRDNAASIRVAMSVGACLESETDFRDRRFQVFRHPLPDAAVHQ